MRRRAMCDTLAPWETTAAQLTGELAERYRVERNIGEGGMASVYLAHNLRGGQVSSRVLV